MTKQEHKLMLMMFVQQMHCTLVLVDILKTRGVIEEDDFVAFHSALSFEGSPEDLTSTLSEAYGRLARTWGRAF